ncbi:hypothetical protein J1614_004359 [Plenodomus biglobosus]|nr:hypothetical protein J1614_004359 [Plenodomus biglobosus]
MPKVNKNSLVSKDISVIFEGVAVTVKISKHFSPSDIYRTIHHAIHHSHPSNDQIRITDDHGNLLDLRYETLKHTSRIFAHRSDTIAQGPASGSASSRKANKFLDQMVQHWALTDTQDILPHDLQPRVRPPGAAQYATKDHVKAGILSMPPQEWSVAFTTALYHLSKVTMTKSGHDMAIAMLRGLVAERHADKDAQHRKVYEAMTVDVRKAAETRAAQLKELAAEGYGVALFAGGLGEALVGVEEEEKKGKGKEVEEEKESAPHSFMMAYRPKKEQGDEWL